MTQEDKTPGIDKAEMLDLLKQVSDEFDRLSRLDSPESVNPNEKLWTKVDASIKVLAV